MDTIRVVARGSVVSGTSLRNQLVKRILLVDDDRLTLRTTKRFLLRCRLDVETANNGPDALDILRDDASYDTLVLDYAMPVMNGLELAEQAIELIPNVHVVIYTGHASGANRHPLVESGRVTVVTKGMTEELALQLDVTLC